MTTATPETTDLEELWNESPPTCQLMWGSEIPCGKLAHWTWIIDCECGLHRVYVICNDCRDKIISRHISNHVNPDCTRTIEQKWVPL